MSFSSKQEQTEKIKKLINDVSYIDLENSDPEKNKRREAAETELASIGFPAVNPLIESLKTHGETDFDTNPFGPANTS